MPESYLGTDVLAMAVEMEKVGERFYHEAQNSIKDPNVREVFEYLAGEEEKHLETFEEMLKRAGDQSKPNPFIDPVGPEYIRELISGRVFTVADAPWQESLFGLKEAMQFALTLEKDSVLFYHEMLSITSHHDIDMVKQILDEERDHILKILDLKKAMKV